MASILSNLVPEPASEISSALPAQTPRPQVVASRPGPLSQRGAPDRDGPAAAAERRLKFIIESVPCGLMVVDASGQVLAANRAALLLHRVDEPAAVVGHHVDTLVGAEQHEPVVAFIGEVAGGLSRSIVYPAGGGNGEVRLVEANGVPLQKADGAAAVLMAAWDVTDWKSAAADQENLRIRCLDIESERHALYAALETAKHEIVLADAGAREKIAQAVRLAQQEMQAALADLAQRHAQAGREWADDREALTRKLSEAEQREAALSADAIAERAARYAALQEAEQQRHEAASAAARVAALEEEVRTTQDAREELVTLRTEHEQLLENLQELNRSYAALVSERTAERDVLTAALRRETARGNQLAAEREECRMLIAGLLRTAQDASDQVQVLFDRGKNLRLVTPAGTADSGDLPVAMNADDQPSGDAEGGSSWRF